MSYYDLIIDFFFFSITDVKHLIYKNEENYGPFLKMAYQKVWVMVGAFPHNVSCKRKSMNQTNL